MSVSYKAQVYAECDACRHFEVLRGRAALEFAAELSGRGWRLGKRCLCPRCASQEGGKRANAKQ